jgi:hypothetical protein
LAKHNGKRGHCHHSRAVSFVVRAAQQFHHPRWLGALSTPERIERIANAKEELYRHLVRRDGISPLPGVASWLHRLHKQGWSQAIASAAPRANIETVLEALSDVSHLHKQICLICFLAGRQLRRNGIVKSDSRESNKGSHLIKRGSPMVINEMTEKDMTGLRAVPETTKPSSS